MASVSRRARSGGGLAAKCGRWTASGDQLSASAGFEDAAPKCHTYDAMRCIAPRHPPPFLHLSRCTRPVTRAPSGASIQGRASFAPVRSRSGPRLISPAHSTMIAGAPGRGRPGCTDHPRPGGLDGDRGMSSSSAAASWAPASPSTSPAGARVGSCSSRRTPSAPARRRSPRRSSAPITRRGRRAQMALLARGIFERWADEVGGECGFVRTGMLFIGPPESRDRVERTLPA